MTEKTNPGATSAGTPGGSRRKRGRLSGRSAASVLLDSFLTRGAGCEISPDIHARTRSGPSPLPHLARPAWPLGLSAARILQRRERGSHPGPPARARPAIRARSPRRPAPRGISGERPAHRRAAHQGPRGRPAAHAWLRDAPQQFPGARLNYSTVLFFWLEAVSAGPMPSVRRALTRFDWASVKDGLSFTASW